MAQLIVRNLDEVVKRKLQRRAARHGRSMEEEVRGIGLKKPIPELRGYSVNPVKFD